MSAEESPSEAPVFNEAEALARLGYDRELFRELAQMILAALPAALEEIEAALAQQDTARLRRVAHDLKGHLGSIGVGPVVLAARELEASARAGDLAQARKANAELLRHLDRLRPAVQIWIRNNGG